jgi:hypothetical protein
MSNPTLLSAPVPFMRTFSPLESSWEDMIRETQVIKVDISNETKRSYTISIHCGMCRHKINIDTQLPNLKYHTRLESNMWSGEQYTAYYLKAKSVQDLVDHVLFILEKWWSAIFLDTDVSLVFHRTSAFLQLTQNVKFGEYRAANATT